jgi:CubicO group peptidase (beta-lactamase class C family)
MDRRELLGLGVSIGALASSSRIAAGSAQAVPATPAVPTPPTGPYSRCFERLDQYVARYMTEMNIPGLTLCLADANGVQRVCDYGVEDLERGTPLATGKLFQIGSISKSFLALCLMQLRDEGRFDPHRPIKEYLPWVRYDGFDKPITPHDLMTHSAALPDGRMFPPDPALRYRATAAAGSFFHYCNMGWTALGYLVEKIDGRPLAESLRERIFRPLGMDATEGAINFDILPRVAMSYQPLCSDRPFPRRGALVQGAPIVYTEAAGCIASTAHDMGRYLQLIINRGSVGGRPLVSPAGFELFIHPHIAADEFGAGSFYGYGMAIDQLDGHRRISHTGGMVSFSSALQVDADAGVGAFASINAMQGGRPTAVAEYALQLMRACREGAALPTFPPASPAFQVARAGDYAGAFTGAGGRVLQIVADGDRLYLLHRNARVPLEPSGDFENAFMVLHDDWAHYALLFTRGGADGKGPVMEAGWGEDWYAAPAYQGAREFHAPAEWSRITGHYRTEDPWVGSVRVVSRRGRLWFNGVTPLEPAAGGRFYLRDEPTSPEWLEFSDFVNGYAMLLHFSGYVLQRV